MNELGVTLLKIRGYTQLSYNTLYTINVYYSGEC